MASENFINYANSFQTVISLGLERISALLNMAGDPQDRCRCIHIGGTNGKGSVCAFLEAMLMAAGLRVGRYTSPNLVRVNERITVDGVQISDEELNPLLEKVGERCVKVRELTGETPTQFEVWTAAAFEYFAAADCDYVLLEVGMGGAYDATNVIKSNAAAVLTRIALDHCAYLGNTAPEIALTKCGIIKKNSITVTVNQAPEVNSVIEACAADRHNRLFTAEPPVSLGFNGTHEIFEYKGRRLLCGLGGPHQLENAAIAIAVAEALGIEVDSICKGVEAARHPARLEPIAPGLIFDGAHNPNGVEALVTALDRYFPQQEMTVIFACMKDKDIIPSLRLLSAPNRSFVFTQVVGNPRSMTAEELRSVAVSAGIDGEAAPDLVSAVRLASEKGRPAVICGSLYLYESIKYIQK